MACSYDFKICKINKRTVLTLIKIIFLFTKYYKDLNNNFHDRQNENLEKAMVKVTKLRPYLASISRNNTFECVTLIDSKNMITYAHKEHENWKVGDEFDVCLFNGNNVVAQVADINQNIDIIWLVAKTPLEIKTIPSVLPYRGQLYIQLGFSAIEQPETSLSVQIGKY